MITQLRMKATHSNQIPTLMSKTHMLEHEQIDNAEDQEQHGHAQITARWSNQICTGTETLTPYLYSCAARNLNFFMITLPKGMPLNFCPYPQFNGMPLGKLTFACCSVHSNGGGAGSDRL